MSKNDKVIKDLKERNDKLSNQIKLIEIRLYSQEYKNNELQEENKQLKNNWNKLKNIAKRQSDLKQKLFNDRLYFEVDEILEIMEEIEKGEDNEQR